MENGIYHDISTRTGGDIYIGVVGPVRTGKSTFIKRFMETMVLPGMENMYKRERARDELPQSGAGRTIMTAEPKFVPEEAAEIALPEGGVCRVRLVDCVGYLVEGALGSMENDTPRMVSTPWREEPMTLAEAAEIGTHRVIGEHSTIGLVITTDGSFTDIPRESYIPAERRVIKELQELGKPFLVIVNSSEPTGERAEKACSFVREQYGVEPIAANCADLNETGISEILQQVLYEFPLCELGLVLPRYIAALPPQSEVQRSIYRTIREAASSESRMRDLAGICDTLCESEYIASAAAQQLDLGCGTARIRAEVPDSVFYGIVEQETGVHITSARRARSGTADRLRHRHALDRGADARGTRDRPSGRPLRCAPACFRTVHPSAERQYPRRGQSDRRLGKTVRGACALSAQRVPRRARKDLGNEHLRQIAQRAGAGGAEPQAQPYAG